MKMYTLLLYFLISTYIIPIENPQLTINISIEVVDGYIRIGVFNESDVLKKASLLKIIK